MSHSTHSDPDDDRDLSTRLTSTSSTRPRDLLPKFALAAALTPKVRRQIAADTPQVIVLHTPSIAWSSAVGVALMLFDNSLKVRCLTDVKASGAFRRALDTELLADLGEGRTVVAVTHDPDTMLSAEYRGAVDLAIDMATTPVRLVRRAIRALSGQEARGLVQADLAGLDFEDLVAALRPGSRAGTCVARLKRGAATRQARPDPAIPSIEALPLTAALRLWSTELLADIKRVEAADLPPSALAGVVLAGPPGGGKTLLAAALAKSAGWTLCSTSVAAWFSNSNGHLGGVSQACRQFFDAVLSTDRCVGFLDELDALPDRATMGANEREWWTPVVTSVLLQIDRVRQSGKKVILIGATNYFERLDSALVRPGRLSRRVPVAPPATEAELADVFAYFLKDDLEASDALQAARLARGATPALIEAWVLQARAKARAQGRSLSRNDLLLEVAPADTRSAAEIRTAALHEAGHAVVALQFGMPVRAVSILAAGATGGWTETAMAHVFPRRHEIEQLVVVLLAGRAADLVLGHGANVGAESDLAMATRLLADARASQGLYDRLLAGDGHSGAKNPVMTEKLTEAVEGDLQRLLRTAVTIVTEREALIAEVADALIEQRVISGPELAVIAGATPKADCNATKH